jgi:hypothetical protein
MTKQSSFESNLSKNQFYIYMRAISTINDISTHAKYSRFELAKDTFSHLEQLKDTFLPKNRPHCFYTYNT